MNNTAASKSTATLPASITKAASLQTYYTIRLLADRERVDDALRAYAYFRWVDDTLDAPNSGMRQRQYFLMRQQDLLARCYRRETPRDVSEHEVMLVKLVKQDQDKHGGLRVYLNNMMAVMAFDVERRGRLIRAAELNEYTHNLASAVTECMHYFVGHRCASPRDETRYLAVSAAHITHMLRDAVEDIRAGYYNIPLEVLEAGGISPDEVGSEPFRAWVKGRVELARNTFETGRSYLQRVQSPRCRLAGLAYIARFESVLSLIEKDGYVLRASYPERKGLGAIVRGCLSVSTGFLDRHKEYVPAAGAAANERSYRGL